MAHGPLHARQAKRLQCCPGATRGPHSPLVNSRQAAAMAHNCPRHQQAGRWTHRGGGGATPWCNAHNKHLPSSVPAVNIPPRKTCCSAAGAARRHAVCAVGVIPSWSSWSQQGSSRPDPHAQLEPQLVPGGRAERGNTHIEDRACRAGVRGMARGTDWSGLWARAAQQRTRAAGWHAAAPAQHLAGRAGCWSGEHHWEAQLPATPAQQHTGCWGRQGAGRATGKATHPPPHPRARA